LKKRKKGREKKKDKKVVYRGYSYPPLRDGTVNEYEEYYIPVKLELGLEVEGNEHQGI